MSLIKNLAYFSLICMGTKSAAAAADGKSQPSPVVSISLDQEPQFSSWAWDFNVFVGGFGKAPDPSSLHIYDLSSGRLTRKFADQYFNGTHPVLLGDERVAFVEENSRLRVLDLGSGKEIARAELGSIGPVGELAFVKETFWLYSIEQLLDGPRPRMFAVPLAQMRSITMGSGYYPRCSGGAMLYFTSGPPTNALIAAVLRDGQRHVDEPPQVIIESDVYAPQLVPGTDLLVYQRGFSKPWIDVLNFGTRQIARLSPEGVIGRWPMVSPSGQYVAFAAKNAHSGRESDILVINLKGERIYKGDFGLQPIGAAYRWARDTDQLGVLRVDDSGNKVFEIIALQR